MAFQTYFFILAFLPLTAVLWWGLNSKGYGRTAQGVLLAASLVFYGWSYWPSLFLLGGSILFHFALGKGLYRAKRWRKGLLALGVLGSLFPLVYCKYSGFLLENVNLLFGTSLAVRQVLIPLGLSFFTFQQLGFLMDIYRGKPMDYTLLEYACFVSFFPCVVSGPIAFHDEVIPQLRGAAGRRVSGEELAQGIWLFSVGLWKKVILAQTFGKAADWGFGAIGELNSTTAILVVLSYTFQLYFDFSGYTDMARGVGRLLGIALPDNFNAPYQALSVTSFWKRWHMTMTRFFTRYLYLPLGGSRRGTIRTYRNVLIVFLVSGLWHGANWTFVLWGALHGCAMVLERALGPRVPRFHPALAWGLTFAFVSVCWIFFRAPTIGDGWAMCQAIAHCDFGGILPLFTSQFHLPMESWLGRWLGLDLDRLALMMTLLFFAAAFLFVFLERDGERKEERTTFGVWNGGLCALLVFWSMISFTGVTQFLYSVF